MRFFFLIVLMLVHFGSYAQNMKIRNHEFFFSIGFSEIEVDKYPQNENLDFLNYLDNDSEFPDYILVKFGYRFDFLSKMKADIRIIMMDEIVPDNYDISVKYVVSPWLGIGVGSILNKNYISNFENYHIEAFENYHLLDYNMKQFEAYELGFYLTPIVKPIVNDIVEFQIALDLGVASFLNQEAFFAQKKKFSNEKMIYKYSTEINFQPYIQPKFDLRIKTLKIKNTTVGLFLNSTYSYSERNIKYTRSIQRWTLDNIQLDNIAPPKHSFSRWEMNLGIFFQL